MNEVTEINYLIAFFSGVAVSFTPCVYPLMPITASFIGGINTQGTRWMGLIISVVYVLGMALTYCVFGVLAALTGKIFGQLQNHPIVPLIVGNVLIFLALVMFDVIPFPVLGLNQQKPKPKNLWAVLLVGAMAGLAVGPCTAPVLGTLLTFVASKQNLLYGITLLFVFSYGVGASLILVGTFSGLLSRLPKSGWWLVRIKQACGVILLVAAEFYLIEAGKLLL